MKDLVIIGAGGFAREASLMIEEINSNNAREENKWNLLGYIDENEEKWGSTLRGYPVLGGWDALKDLPTSIYIICIVGNPEIKKRMVEKAVKQSREFATLVARKFLFLRMYTLAKGFLLIRVVLLLQILQ